MLNKQMVAAGDRQIIQRWNFQRSEQSHLVHLIKY